MLCTRERRAAARRAVRPRAPRQGRVGGYSLWWQRGESEIEIEIDRDVREWRHHGASNPPPTMVSIMVSMIM